MGEVATTNDREASPAGLLLAEIPRTAGRHSVKGTPAGDAESANDSVSSLTNCP